MSADRPPPSPPPPTPVTEADLHAFVDAQLPAERLHEIEAYLAGRPEEAQRVEAYRAQKRKLHALFDPVLDEQTPRRLLRAARPMSSSPTPWYLQRLAAGVVIAVISGATGFGLRGVLPALNSDDPGRMATSAPLQGGITLVSASGFAQRAAVAHAVYSPDARRPVEVDAAHEEQLVAWLSKRMGAPMKPPQLQAQGYALEGGRLLPGGQGPVAQFMYRNELGSKLTLYVSNEVGDLDSVAGPGAENLPGTKNADTAFRFAQQGAVNVFYWVDGAFGYALSADVDRAVLARVSAAVHQQLGNRR